MGHPTTSNLRTEPNVDHSDGQLSLGRPTLGLQHNHRLINPKCNLSNRLHLPLSDEVPSGDLVSEVRGDQEESQHCYTMSTRVTEKHKMVNTIFHLEDMAILPGPSNISHTLRELDPREKETETIGDPIEELESIKLDNQHPDRTV